MKFFLDTADIQQIEIFAASGFVDGVTTNPSLIAKSGGDFIKTIKKIAGIVSGPVSAECVALDFDTMLEEGQYIASLAENIAVKVPLTVDGLKVCKILSDRKIMVNVTLCFSVSQALLAAKAGASFISPFVGRLDDLGENGMKLIDDIRLIYNQYNFSTKILVASIRHPQHITAAAKLGAHIVTMPPQVLGQLYKHPLTDIGIQSFLTDWNKMEKSRKKIL